MYERFTDRARKVMQLANQEAQRFNHEYIGTEHILLGLVKDGSGVAAKVLKNLGVELRKVRREVEKVVQSGPDYVPMGKLPQTPRAKKVVEYALEESRKLNHSYVGTEHLLLGLIREQEGVAAQILINLGLTLDELHRQVLNVLGQDTAGVSRSSLNFDLPDPDLPEVRYFNAEITRLTREKEAAVDGQDFDLAAGLRDQADKLQKMRKQFIAKWWKDVGPIPDLPALQELDAAIQRVTQEKMAVVARCDSEIERLKAERERIITEWGQKKLGRGNLTGEPGA